MVALMEPTTDAEEMAGCTLSATELDICLHFDNHVVEFSTQVLYGSMATLESHQIAIQPGSDIIHTQVDQIIQACPKFRNEFRVRQELPRHGRDP